MLIILLLLLVSPIVAFEENKVVGNSNHYWVYFEGVPFHVDHEGEVLSFICTNPDKCPPENVEGNTIPTSLSPRALHRRSKVLRENLVHFEDIPVCEGYVNEVKLLFEGVRVRQRSAWLNAVSIEVPSASSFKERVLSLPFVRDVGPVPVYQRDDRNLVDARRGSEDHNKHSPSQDDVVYGESLPQLNLIGVPSVHRMGYNGTGIRVMILDTGFLKTHDAFHDLVIVDEYDFIDDDNDTMAGMDESANQNHHGTATLSCLAGHSPGILVGSAPGVEVILARTEDVSSETIIEEDYFISALEWGEGLGADIATASLGYTDWYSWSDLNGSSPLAQACDRAVTLGMVVVVANGNDGHRGISVPADAHLVISIGAVSSDSTVASFSSLGPTADLRLKPDVCAWGVSNWVADSSHRSTYARMSGTSFATPLTSGVVALLLQAHPDWTPPMIWEALTSTATQAAVPDRELGFGIIDASAAILALPRIGDCSVLGCLNDGVCSGINGSCACSSPFYGRACELTRVSCADYCYSDRGTCLPDGSCQCFDGGNYYTGGFDCYFGQISPRDAGSLILEVSDAGLVVPLVVLIVGIIGFVLVAAVSTMMLILH